MKVLIAGRGRVGRGLYATLRNTKLNVSLRASRNPRRTDARTVLFAVPDDCIEEVATAWMPHTHTRAVFLHCAGSLGPEAFGEIDRVCGTLHPLISFADPKRPPRVHGATFALAGSTRARKAGRSIARACGARVIETEGFVGAAYHASAALVANGTAALATVGVDILQRIGADRVAAQHAISALLHSVADNVANIGVPAALTGPIMRGDASTVGRHRKALRKHERTAYDALAPAILRVAKQAGLSRARARAVADQLRKTK